MNINNIIKDLNLNYEDMNIDNYAYIDNRINYNIIKKIFESYHTEKKDVYFRFFPFYIINEKEKYYFYKYKYDDKKNKKYIKSFIDKILNKIYGENIHEIINKKKNIDEMINDIDDYYNEQLKEKIDNEIKELKLELEEKKQLKLDKEIINLEEQIIKLEKNKNLLNEVLSYDNYKKILEYNDEITKLNVMEEYVEEEGNIIIDIKLEEEEKKKLEEIIELEENEEVKKELEENEELKKEIIELKKEIIKLEENEELKKELEEEKKKLEEEIINLEKQIKKLEEEKKKYDNIENYSEEEKEVMSSYIFNNYEYHKILYENDDVKIDVKKELFKILKKNGVLNSETEIYEVFENNYKKLVSDIEIYELLNKKKEYIQDKNIKKIYDIYINLVEKQFYINLYEQILGEKYINKNNLEELLNKKININDDLIKDYFNMLITKNKYKTEYEKDKKKIENSKIKLKNKLQKKLKTPYFKREEDLKYINLFKINEKTPINLGTYEVSGEKVDKKEFEIILCSKSDYEKKIDEINENYNFNGQNIFFIKIYDKEKISDNMENKYSYFVGENILQDDGYIYTKEFNFITNSNIIYYEPDKDKDYYEGYIKPIKDVDKPKLLDYICENTFFLSITNTFILYNKYLSKFNRKLKIKVKNAAEVNTKISDAVKEFYIEKDKLGELKIELGNDEKKLNILKSEYNLENNNFIDSLEKIIAKKRTKIREIKNTKKIDDNDIKITEEKKKKEIEIEIEIEKKKIEKKEIEKKKIEKKEEIKKKEKEGEIEKIKAIIEILNLYIEIRKITNDIKIIRDLKKKININKSTIKKYENINSIDIPIENKEYDINEFEKNILFLEWIDINYDSFINIVIIDTLDNTKSIDLKITIDEKNLKNIDLQYRETINEINNKTNKTLSEYFFLCIIYDILQNNYNEYNKQKQKYLCIDNFYVNTLNINNLYIDRIF